MKFLKLCKHVLLSVLILLLFLIMLSAYVILPPPASVVTTLFRMSMQIMLKFCVPILGLILISYGIFLFLHKSPANKLATIYISALFIIFIGLSYQWIRVATVSSKQSNIAYKSITPGISRIKSRPVLVQDDTTSDNTFQCQIFQDSSSPYKSTALVYLNYGGWTVNSLSMGTQLQNFCRKEGYTFIRFAAINNASKKINDTLYTCTSKLKELLETQNFDHVYLTGGSAGGHIALLSALIAEDNPFKCPELNIDGVIALYPSVDPGYCYDYYVSNDKKHKSLLDKLGDALYSSLYQGTTGTLAGESRILYEAVFGIRGEASSLYKAANIETLLSDHDMPILIVQGSADSMMNPNPARHLYATLKAQNRTAVYLELPGTEHVFDMMPTAAWDRCEKEMTGFIRTLENSKIS